MLRQAIRPSKPVRPIAKPLKWVAPVKGWMTAVPIAEMPEDAASTLINFFPEAGYIRARNGANMWQNMASLSLTVQDASLLPFEGPNPKLFFVVGSGAGGVYPIYDVTVPNQSPPVVALPTSSLICPTNLHVSSTQISTAGGHYMMVAPAVSGPLRYDGTNWVAAGYTGAPNGGLNLNVVVTYRERIYFLENGTTMLWYGGTNAITGALNSIDLGADLKYGGVPVAMQTWTKEVYTGVLQFLVIVSSVGEVLVFQGSNPSDPTNWSLLGTFKLSPPLGADRCLVNLGADLIIMTQDGVIPISQAIQVEIEQTDVVALTKPIAPSFLDAVQSTGPSTIGWSFATYPHRRMAIVNVPDPARGTYQFVMNTDTQAWCQYSGWNALTFKTWNGGLYFVDPAANVAKAETGSQDYNNAPPIQAVYHGPWARGDGISQKSPRLMTIDGLEGLNTQVYGGVSVDYNPVMPQQTGTAGPTKPVAKWDVAKWDVDVWPGQAPAHLIFNANAPLGIALAPSVMALINGTVSDPSNLFIYGGTILYEPGTYI